MAPRVPRDILEAVETDHDLEVHQADKASEMEDDEKGTENQQGAEEKKKRRSSPKTDPNPAQYERTGEMVQIITAILAKLGKILQRRKGRLPKKISSLERQLPLPEEVSIEDIQVSGVHDKCPTSTRDCKKREFSHKMIHLVRGETTAQISWLLRHLLNDHQFKATLLPVDNNGLSVSFRDLIFVLLNEDPDKEKKTTKKKTTKKRPTAKKKVAKKTAKKKTRAKKKSARK